MSTDTKSLGVYTCLNAQVSEAIIDALTQEHGIGQIRLWIMATNEREAKGLLRERGIKAVWPVAGPCDRRNPFDEFESLGWFKKPAVFAYGFPSDPAGPVLRIAASGSFERVSTVRTAMPHLDWTRAEEFWRQAAVKR